MGSSIAHDAREIHVQLASREVRVIGLKGKLHSCSVVHFGEVQVGMTA